MSMMVSFVLSFFPRDVLDEILKLIESVSEDFPSYSFMFKFECMKNHTMDIRYTKTAGVTIKYQGQTYVMLYNGKRIYTSCGTHT